VKEKTDYAREDESFRRELVIRINGLQHHTLTRSTRRSGSRRKRRGNYASGLRVGRKLSPPREKMFFGKET